MDNKYKTNNIYLFLLLLLSVSDIQDHRIC